VRRSASRSGRGASTCFATPARMVARVGFQPTVSWMKARHVGALHQRAMRLVPPPGVEPGTARVRTVCSGRLSYGGNLSKRSVTEESDLHCSNERPFYGQAAGPPACHRSGKRVPTERLELPGSQALDLWRLPLPPRRQSDPVPPASRKLPELDLQARTKSAMTDGTALSKPTTSSAPASSGSAI
jgi:hypothetical protein